jgi:hypothetical protein
MGAVIIGIMPPEKTPKSIQTWYDGFHFRSRLEARHATFFKSMGIRYEYEVETYDLGSAGYYLPDFWLPHYKTWVEIKGAQPTQKEKEKLRALTEMTESYGFIFSGQIEVPSLQDYGIQGVKTNNWDIIFREDESDARRKQTRLFDDFYNRNKINRATCAYVRGEELKGSGHWFTCLSCGKPAIYTNGYVCSCGGVNINHDHINKLIDAYRTARAARFEYEERYKMRLQH